MKATLEQRIRTMIQQQKDPKRKALMQELLDQTKDAKRGKPTKSKTYPQ